MAQVSLTGQQLYDLTTNLLGGYQMDTTLFYQLLNMAKAQREGARQWRKLVAVDNSQQILPGETWQTSKNLASDFLQWLDTDPIILLAADNINYQEYEEIPFERRIVAQNDQNKYCVDYANNLIYLTGNVDQAYTMYQNYIKSSPDINAATSWVFPYWSHALLAYDVAVNYKGGIDFDDINARMVEYNEKWADRTWQSLLDWDSNLQVNATRGMNRYTSQNQPWRGGRINEED